MILAFGFGNVWMLGWLAAAAAPILIHLWNRRHHQEHAWAATRFLLKALQTQARRLRIEQWLLLALRVAAIAFVMLAAAQPFATSLPRTLTSEPVHRIFVLDCSFSMAYRPAAETLFDHARDRIRELIESAAPGDAASLVTMGLGAQTIVGAPSFQPQQFLGELDRVKCSDGIAHLGDALQAVENVIARAEQTTPRLTQREVYVFSDLTRPTWQPDDAAARAALARSFASLQERAEVRVVNVAPAAASNLAITSLQPLEGLVSTRNEVEFEAGVRGWGGSAAAAELTAIVDGRTVESGRLALSPDQSGSWTFSHRFDKPGEHTLEVRVADERLTPDDRRWRTINVRDQIRVLAVLPTGADLQRDSLLLALDPTQSGAGLVAVTVSSEADWPAEPLEEFSAVVFENVEQFAPAEARRLATYLGQGGSVVFVLGDRVDIGRYNEVLGGGPNRTRLLPLRLTDLAAAGDYRFDPLGYLHPAVASFRGQEAAGLLTAVVARYVRMAGQSGSSAATAMAFNSGDPALVIESLAGGRVMVLATPITATVDRQTGLPWNSLAASPALVPLVQEMLRTALESHDAEDLLVGRVLTGRAPGGAEVRDPAGQQHSVTSSVEQGGAWSFTAEQAGVYEVISRGGATRLFAVNVDPRESDISHVAADWLPPAVLDGATGPAAASAGSVSAAAPRPLERGCLALGLALLAIEGWYAWSLGRRR
jgi:hypothetical protein